MKVFNEEGAKSKPQVLVLLEGLESRDLIEALESAIKAHPRRTKWKALLKKLDECAAY